MKLKTVTQHLKAIPCTTISAMALKAYRDYGKVNNDRYHFSATALSVAFAWDNNSVLSDKDFWKAVHIELDKFDTGVLDSVQIKHNLYQALHDYDFDF
jgi:hypothetical protein